MNKKEFLNIYAPRRRIRGAEKPKKGQKKYGGGKCRPHSAPSRVSRHSLMDYRPQIRERFHVFVEAQKAALIRFPRPPVSVGDVLRPIAFQCDCYHHFFLHCICYYHAPAGARVFSVSNRGASSPRPPYTMRGGVEIFHAPKKIFAGMFCRKFRAHSARHARRRGNIPSGSVFLAGDFRAPRKRPRKPAPGSTPGSRPPEEAPRPAGAFLLSAPYHARRRGNIPPPGRFFQKPLDMYPGIVYISIVPRGGGDGEAPQRGKPPGRGGVNSICISAPESGDV